MKGRNARIILYWQLLFLVSMIIPSEQATKPNIVFILADDVGWNDVGFHGNNVMQTPNIDALAYSGVILHEYYVTPLCSPTRSALLTARQPGKTGMWERVINATQPYGLDPEEKILPQYLKEHNYSTYIVGKWHQGCHKSEYLPTNRGFDYHYGNRNSRIDYFTYRHHTHACVIGLDLYENLEPAFDALNNKREYVTRLYTRKSKEIIKKHNKEKPLFLYLAHAAVHIANHCKPMQAPSDTIDKFKDIDVDETRRIFAAMMYELDDSVGEVVTALKEANMLENTIIVFSTDNGGATVGFPANPGNNWPLRSGKGTFWQGGVRATGFVWSPLLSNTPRVSKQLMHVQDWIPTLLGSFDETPKGSKFELDGVNGWPALNDPTKIVRNDALLVIDTRDKFEAIIQMRANKLYKLTNGSASYHKYDQWYKTEERTGTYEWSKIQNSKVAKAIANTKANLPVVSKLEDLRKDATLLQCEKLTGTSCVLSNEHNCLFDLNTDPCEQVDIAGGNLDIVKEMKAMLDKEREKTIPSRAEPDDAASYPDQWNNLWVPWKDFV